MAKKVEVLDRGVRYSYFEILEDRGNYTVFQCSVHWASGWSRKQTVGSAKTQADALDLIKSFSGGQTLKFV
jgi:hypothetical protein